jgi:hypothetical protein
MDTGPLFGVFRHGTPTQEDVAVWAAHTTHTKVGRASTRTVKIHIAMKVDLRLLVLSVDWHNFMGAAITIHTSSHPVKVARYFLVMPY